MSTYRFRHIEDLFLKTGPKTVTEIDNNDYKLLDPSVLFAGVETINEGSIFTESHIYTDNSEYIKSVYDVNLLLDQENNGLFLNVRDIFNKANITNGYFKIISNFLLPVFGNPLSEKNPFFIKEISADRTELKLVLNSDSLKPEFNNFKELLFSFDFHFIFNFLVLNFYQNEVYKVVNLRFDKNDKRVFYVKLYSSLSDSIEETSNSWFGLEVFDSYVDDVLIERHITESTTKKLKGPNFYINAQMIPSNQTMYKNWNDLLDSDLETTQNILDKLFNSSKTATLNIDYTNFKNFVFYSKAERRIENFYSKIKLIEDYNNDINDIQNSDVYSKLKKTQITKRIDKLKENFDPFERWLYYQPTGSLFTHDANDIITPYPKYKDNNKIVYNNTNDQIVADWYSSSLSHAKEYDLHNYNCLINTVPEYLLLDDSNSVYLTFVEMIGHHFDNLYAYANSLQQIHERDEHPERGFSNDLIYPIAKSFGWELQDINSLSNLWNYKLGTDETGSIVQSNNIDIIPHENQTKNVWRRIVNNLPFLLKTKGTKTSLNALMSIYGIPQTLLSVKEFGGPGLVKTKPIAVSTKHSYKLNIDENSYILVPQDRLNVAKFGWGRGSICKGEENPVTRERLPDTYEFRFTTKQKNVSGSIPLFVQTDETNNAIGMLSLVSSSELEGKEIISGSYDYGKLLYETENDHIYSDYIPVFDGDLWTVKIEDVRQFLNNENEIRVSIGRAKDCLRGNVNHFDYFTLPLNSLNSDNIEKVLICPTLGSFDINFNEHNQITKFIGSVQGYKEYFTTYNNDTFFNHIRNPKAYNTDTPSGSFYSLYRYYPLGLDLKKYNHSSVLNISSSHPDQNHHQPSVAEFIGFSGDERDQYTYIKETYYAEVPKIADENIFSNKIRIEKAILESNLSVDRRVEVGEFDNDLPDSRRLVVAFSTANQINNDIIDHTGFFELDDYFGDPSEEFNSEYKDLTVKRHEYFQKYERKNNINELIRLLSLYDYTFFEQIKQLVPAKSDLISGILIEPHILERPKVQISKKPNISTHHYDEVIDLTEDVSAEMQDIKGNIEHENEIKFEYSDIRGNFDYKKPDTYGDYFLAKGLIIEQVFGGGNFIPPITDPHLNCIWKRKKCEFLGYSYNNAINKNPRLFTDPAGLDVYEFDNAQEVTKNDGIYDIDLISNIHDRNIFKNGVILNENNVIKQDVSINIDGKNKFVLRAFVASNPFNSSAEIEMSNVTDSEYITINSKLIDGKYLIQEVRFYFEASYKESVPLYIRAINGSVIVFSFSVHKYKGKRYESVKKMYHRETMTEPSCQLERWYYQYNESSKKNNFRFKGSKLVGPGINIDSENTIDKGPVVEVRTTNPNKLNVGFGDSDGNFKVG